MAFCKSSSKENPSAFLAGTRKALKDVDRLCFTITLERLDEASLGALIAFWERVVGYLASLWQINAYDQPGVEAGKVAAKGVLALQDELLTALSSGQSKTASEWAVELEADEELCFHILRRLAYNERATSSGEGRTRRFSSRA